MGFYFTDLITGYSSPEGPAYPIDQMRCSKIGDELGSVNEGDMILLEVHAHLGETLAADNAMIYTPGAQTLPFPCTGTTFNCTCKLNGGDSDYTDDEI